MKKYFLILLILTSCSQNITQNNESVDNLITETSFQYVNTNLTNEYEIFNDKKTIIVFWADYWSVCRRELPVLERELNNLTETYDVIALAHSEFGPTLEWVENNLNGDLKIGFSTSELRDYFKIVGQPITIILDTNGEVIFREFGEINFTNF